MLIQITNACPCNCTHCFVNAVPNGKHMDDATFIKSVQFAIDNEMMIINISGGEPVLHPKFFRFMSYLLDKIKRKSIGVGIETSGIWILDEQRKEHYIKQLRSLLDKEQVGWLQISTNKKYYPTYDKLIEHEFELTNIHEKAKFTKDWQGVDTNLAYMGRAKNFMKEEDITGIPNCMNWIQYALSMKLQGKHGGNILKQISDFAIKERFKSCVPTIDVNGNIRITEGIDCAPIGNIHNYFPAKKREFSQKLVDNILNYRICNKCKAAKNIPDIVKLSVNKMCLENNVELKFT